ncbi:MAG: hypothetical protein KC550_03710 [Nanoarchaeota archaeon]|nr:hypothetical protein [Nanoarchaeota archaeon]
MDIKLNNKEKILVLGLRKEGKNNVLSIANQNKIPKSTMFDLYRKLKKYKIINESVLLDFEKIGYPIKAFFILKVSIKEKIKLRLYLKNSSYVNSLYMLGNGQDYLVEGIFRNFKEVHEFEQELTSNFEINEKQMLNVIENIVQENFMSKSENLDEMKNE